MKKILLFHRDKAGNDTLNCFTELLAKEFNKKGIETKVFDIEPYFLSTPDISVLTNEIVNSGCDAAIAFNAIGQEKYSIDNSNVYDIAGIPFINYIVDHPLDHIFAMKNVPKDYYVVCMDREHVEFVKTYLKDVKDAFFLPLGGLYEERKNKEDRIYDVVFTASLFEIGEIERNIFSLPSAIQGIVLDTIDYLLFNRNISVEEGLFCVLEGKGIFCDNPDDHFAYSYATKIIYKYLRSYYREECIRYIMQSDIRLDIFGTGWDKLEDAYSSNTYIHPTIPYYETAKLCQNSKVLFNVMPLFKDGSHDRIATAMLNCSAILTDHSKYLDYYCSDFNQLFRHIIPSHIFFCK